MRDSVSTITDMLSSKIKNIVGQVFGRLTVVRYSNHRSPVKKNSTYWECICRCGQTVIVRGENLKSGSTQSCGCLARKFNRGLHPTLKTHGHSRTKTYRIWSHICYRCHNPNSADFRNYGQRGITVCDRWLVFENFLEDMGTAPAGTSLDRKDNTKGYYKRNCRWATSKQQANNKRTSNRIRFRGKTQTVAQWAEEIGMNYKTLWSRLSKGVPMSQAIKSSK